MEKLAFIQANEFPVAPAAGPSRSKTVTFGAPARQVERDGTPEDAPADHPDAAVQPLGGRDPPVGGGHRDARDRSQEPTAPHHRYPATITVRVNWALSSQ